MTGSQLSHARVA